MTKVYSISLIACIVFNCSFCLNLISYNEHNFNVAQSSAPIVTNYDLLMTMLLDSPRDYAYKKEHTIIYGAKDSYVEIEKLFTPQIDRINYTIVQSKENEQFTASLYKRCSGQFSFLLTDKQGKKIIECSTWASDIGEVVKFVDVNKDGYLDIQFLIASGTLNNEYILYLWDKDKFNYSAVGYNGVLSYYEVNDDYIRNWRKNDANSGVIEKLVWRGNKLIKISEESYNN